jgi:hypothetical protein
MKGPYPEHYGGVRTVEHSGGVWGVVVRVFARLG